MGKVNMGGGREAWELGNGEGSEHGKGDMGKEYGVEERGHEDGMGNTGMGNVGMGKGDMWVGDMGMGEGDMGMGEGDMGMEEMRMEGDMGIEDMGMGKWEVGRGHASVKQEVSKDVGKEIEMKMRNTRKDEEDMVLETGNGEWDGDRGGEHENEMRERYRGKGK
ncbi:hypothetical protein V8E53_008640 [Lactarius tabidus]